MSGKPSVTKRRKYEEDFKAEVLKMVASGRPVSEISQALGIGENLVYRWKSKQVERSNEKTKGQKDVDVWWEVEQLREQPRQTERERNILKCRWKICKWLKKQGLQAIQPKSFVPKTTNSAHRKRNSPNLLLDSEGNRVFQTQSINQVWVGDLTYLPLSDGTFVYLSVWIDLFSRKIVGWQLQENMEESLVTKSVEKALLSRRPEPGLIIHSDWGGQYVSTAYRKLLRKWKCRQSMSRKDNCYDNAIAESLFSRFKAELVENGVFLSLEDAKTECFEYIEIYYNRIR